MNFKRIEMYGFKSFADRQVIEFKDDICVIVGPNGCGKSNVVDAIRWVLGEKRVKTLRGQNMQDVIFKGSEKRSKMGFCEVSLVFDNTNRLFPVEVDELKMTRKLFRSGESAYYINDEKAKLKEIYAVIQNTGLGRDGYSIIGQGRVDEIINARPTDRRVIFEDAAGISGYKKTKKETEDNLSVARMNMERINDAISIIEKDLTPLKIQRDNALKYADLAGSLKNMEINQYIYSKETSESKKQVINSIIQDLQRQMDNANFEKDNANKEYQKCSNESNNIDVVLRNLNDRKLQLAVESEQATSSGKMLKLKLDTIEDKIQELTERINKNDSLSKKTQEDVEDLNHRLSMKKEEKLTLENEFSRLEDKYLKMSEELILQERGINDTNTEIMSALQNIADIKEDKGKLVASKESMLERLEECKQEIEKLENLIVKEEDNKRSIEIQISELQADIKRLERSRDIIEKECDEVDGELDEKQAIKSSLINDINSLEGKIQGYKDASATSYRGTVNSMLQIAQNNPEVNKRIVGVVGKLVKVDEKYNIAIEIALGARVYQIVTPNDSDATFLTGIAKRYNIGRITCIPMNRQEGRSLPYEARPILNERGVIGVASSLVSYDRKFDVLFSELLGTTVIVDNKENALAIAAKYRYRVRLVTLEGDSFDTNRTISGGSIKVKGDLFGSGDSVDEMKATVNKKKLEYQQNIKLIEELISQRKELSEQLDEYESNIHRLQITLATANTKLDRKAEEINNYSTSLEEKIEYRNSFNSIVEMVTQKLLALDVKTESSTEMRVKADVLTHKKREEVEQKRKEREEVNVKKELKGRALAVVLTDIENITAQIALLEDQLVQLREALEEDTFALEEKKAELNATTDELNNVVISDEYKEEFDKIEGQINSCYTRKQELIELIDKANERREKFAKQVEGYIAKVEKQKAELEKVDNNLSDLANYIRDAYDLDYEGSLEFRQEDFDSETAQKTVSGLKKEIEKLGDINPLAVQQYADKSEDYQKQIESRNDVAESMEKMQVLIDELKKVMSERFNSEFEKININFQTIFKEMFGGGKGELVLVEDPELDPLDYGVEIMVQPPGKAENPISLLSGGEKAFTAITILFAILKLKPMPFSVLDEIEAALDEANVGRFAKYLKRFSKETQFIVITHRKPTMKLADILYGVTMEEKGVSKVVATSLEQYGEKE